MSKFNENLDSPMKNFPEEIFGSRSWNFKIIIIRDEKFPQDEKNVEDDHKSDIEQKPWENRTDKKNLKKKIILILKIRIKFIRTEKNIEDDHKF